MSLNISTNELNLGILFNRGNIMTENIKYVPITQFNRGKANQIIDEIEGGKAQVFVIKNNKPRAVLLSMEDYVEFNEYLLYKEIERRMANYNANPENVISREEMMNILGITEDDIQNTEDVEFDYE